MWVTLTNWFNSDNGRRVVKWGTTAIGALMSSGAIPLDTPLVLGLSLGQVLTILGLATPSAAPQKVTDRIAVQSLISKPLL